MKVIVASAGKFHALRLAEQLDKRGHLHKLLTEYYARKNGGLPKLRHDSENITLNKVVTNFIPVLIERGMKIIPKVNHWTNWSHQAAKVFDAWASRQIEPCDLVVSWSGSALHTLRAAKKAGAVAVVERGSAHIMFTKKNTEMEYEKYGIRKKPVDERVADQEVAEYREADYISVPSNFARQTFLEAGVSPAKLIQITYGVDLSNFYPLPKEDSIFRILVVGGLTLSKGLQYLLEALSQLNLSHSELLTVGSIDAELHPFLSRYPGRYRAIGKVPETALRQYYAQASVFVLPTIQEGLSLVIPQAMACGVPVISTTNSGGSEMVREGIDGYIVPIRDVNALKEKIAYLYDHGKERNRMGEAAAQRAKEFSWDRYGEKIVSAYQQVVEIGKCS